MVTTLHPMITRTGSPAASLWSLEPGMHHLNHGSFGGVPDAVLAHQGELRDRMETNPVRWFVELPDRVAAARAQVARQLCVHPHNLAFVPNASAGASVVYRALDNQGPVDVTVTSHGYGAVVMGAQRLARSTGGHLHCVDLPLGATAADIVTLVDQALTQHPSRLLVIDQITSPTARAFPTTELCDVAHAHGALVLVDGAHAPGVLPSPVETRADVWVGNLHKFWCAPRGAAVLVRNNPDLDLHPLIDSWGAPNPFPIRFDFQGTMDVTAWLCAGFAHDHLEEQIGWQVIRDHSAAMMDLAEVEVGDALREAGQENPVPDVGQPVGPMRLLRLPGARPWSHAEVDGLRVPFMNRSSIISSFTDVGGRGFMRLSAHAYTTPDDVRAMATTGVPILAEWIGRLHERKMQ